MTTILRHSTSSRNTSTSSMVVVHGFVRLAYCCSSPHGTTSSIASTISWRKATTTASTTAFASWTTNKVRRRTSQERRLFSHLEGSTSLRRSLFSSSTSSSSSCLKSTTTNPSSDIPSSETLSEEELQNIKELRELRKEERKAKRLKARQEKKKRRSRNRREFIGQAKAVDRGQFDVIYNPRYGPNDTFVAQSGLPDTSKPFVVLGIESSCDDTGAAVVRSDGVILGEALESQSSIHEPFGGVVPNLAREAHLEAIDKVVELALERAGLTVEELDAIGVTVGPGLEICLRVGFRKAQELAIQYQKPFVGVHHLEAHIVMARFASLSSELSSSSSSLPDNINKTSPKSQLEFPFLALLVSGGHCQLLKCIGIGQYEMLGGTLDDSLGEAFDKVARLLDLKCVGGGGGPAIEELAKQGDPTKFPLTIPMQHRADLDFSFSGLKTSVRTSMTKLIEERKRQVMEEEKKDPSNETLSSTSSSSSSSIALDLSVLSQDDKANIAAGFQHTAILHVEQRLKRCLDKLQETDFSTQNIKQLAVVGGVAANQALRQHLETLCESYNIQMMVPPPRLCTDQGTMSAWATIERLHLGSSDDPMTQDVHARYPFCHIISQEDKDGQIK